jgi:hypothetical protein
MDGQRRALNEAQLPPAAPMRNTMNKRITMPMMSSDDPKDSASGTISGDTRSIVNGLGWLVKRN